MMSSVEVTDWSLVHLMNYCVLGRKKIYMSSVEIYLLIPGFFEQKYFTNYIFHVPFCLALQSVSEKEDPARPNLLVVDILRF